MTYPIVEWLRRYAPGPSSKIYEAAAHIEALAEALEKAEGIMSSARIELNRLRAVAKLPPKEPAALNVAVYEAKTALSNLREGQGGEQ